MTMLLLMMSYPFLSYSELELCHYWHAKSHDGGHGQINSQLVTFVGNCRKDLLNVLLLRYFFLLIQNLERTIYAS